MNSKYKLQAFFWSIIILIALSSVASVVARRTNRLPSTNITITNSSSLEIRHVYLAHADQDDWSADQLGDTPITPGHSTTLSNISWDQASLKLIGEDQNGCFFYQTIALADNVTWTITSNATPDCGN